MSPFSLFLCQWYPSREFPRANTRERGQKLAANEMCQRDVQMPFAKIKHFLGENVCKRFAVGNSQQVYFKAMVSIKIWTHGQHRWKCSPSYCCRASHLLQILTNMSVVLLRLSDSPDAIWKIVPQLGGSIFEGSGFIGVTCPNQKCSLDRVPTVLAGAY